MDNRKPVKSLSATRPEKPKTNGKRNREAGHAWELEVIRLLKERGLYPHVVSCRSNSKRLDDAGIDLMNLEEATHGMMEDSIQCKTAVGTVSYPGLLARIRATGRKGAVIFHRQTSVSTDPKYKGGRQVERDRFASTYLDHYMDLLACEKFTHWVQKAIEEVEASDTSGKAIWISNLKYKLQNLGL